MGGIYSSRMLTMCIMAVLYVFFLNIYIMYGHRFSSSSLYFKIPDIMDAAVVSGIALSAGTKKTEAILSVYTQVVYRL